MRTQIRTIDRLDCPQSFLFPEKRAAFLQAINQSGSTSLASFSQIETGTPDRSQKKRHFIVFFA